MALNSLNFRDYVQLWDASIVNPSKQNFVHDSFIESGFKYILTDILKSS